MTITIYIARTSRSVAAVDIANSREIFVDAYPKINQQLYIKYTSKAYFSKTIIHVAGLTRRKLL